MRDSVTALQRLLLAVAIAIAAVWATRVLLAVPALRARYLGYVRDIAERWLDWNKLGPLLAARQGLIAEEVKLDTRKLYRYEAFQAGLDGPENSLKSFVAARRAFLLNFTDPKAGMK